MGVTNEGMERSLDKPATQLILRLHRISPKDTARGGVPESNKSRPECAKPACKLFGAAPAAPAGCGRSVTFRRGSDERYVG
jgi:hypothetical protein